MEGRRPRIAITGASGFLGGRILQHLLKDHAYEIIAFDDDIAVPNHVHAFFDRHKDIDCVIHLASVYDTPNVSSADSIAVNVGGTINALKYAIKAGVKKFIYFSTVHVYGSPLTGYIDETTMTRPMAVYAITHKGAEDFVLAAHRRGDITGIVLRLSNSFGVPANNAKNAFMPIVNNMCKQLVETGDIKIQPGLEMLERDYITVTDVCRVAEHFVNLSKDKCQDGLFNVGGGKTNTLAQIAMFCTGEPKSNYHNWNAKFIYSIDKLEDTGFDLLNNFDQERNDLLAFCEEYYGSSVRK